MLIFIFEHFLQVGENEPFVSELLSNLAATIGDLEPHQIHTFYESVCRTQMSKIWFKSLECIINDFKTFSVLTAQVGHMIQAESDNTKRDEYLKRLMSLPNQVSCFIFLHGFIYGLLLNMIFTWLCFGFVILQKWAEIIGQASQSIDILKNQDVIRSVLNILQVTKRG